MRGRRLSRGPHLLQSSSSMRFAAGADGFLILIRCIRYPGRSMSVVTPIATLLFGAAKRRLGPISDIGPLIRSPGRRAEEAANVGTLMPIMRPRGLCQLQFECECTWGIRTSAIHTQGGQALCQKAASLFCTLGRLAVQSNPNAL